MSALDKNRKYLMLEFFATEEIQHTNTEVVNKTKELTYLQKQVDNISEKAEFIELIKDLKNLNKKNALN